MSNFYDFLVEHAKFPFPLPDEPQSAYATDISLFEVALLRGEWKARHAIRDSTLIQKLCQSLKDTLQDTPLAADYKDFLLTGFSPQLEHVKIGFGFVDEEWCQNPSRSQSRSLLDKGVFKAARNCLWVYGQHGFRTAKEQMVKGTGSRVDYTALVDKEPKVLCEAKSPSAMKKVGELLPLHGIELKWVRGQSLVPKILTKAALCLGLRQMEWLFLTCHNYWVVCRLVRDDDHPFLAYSPKISIEDSSEPFRAFLGAMLSVCKGVSVESSVFSPDIQLDTVIEDEDTGPLPEDDINDNSGAWPNTGTVTDPPMTRGRDRANQESVESRLMVTSSSPESPESSQVWVHLRAMSNNTLALPGKGKRRLWLTRFIGSGSTGNVWECHFDNSGRSFAVKIVELLRRSDVASRQRLRGEFNIYLTLEQAYESGRLRVPIAPRCYGAFEGDGVDVLVLDLCGDVLNTWNELNDEERVQVYKLVDALHSIGIIHADLEPRNVARTAGGGFCLIDFSESSKHICKDSMVTQPYVPHFATVQKKKCFELQAMQKLLKIRLPS